MRPLLIGVLGVLTVALVPAAPAAGQGAERAHSRQDRERGQRMLRQLRETLDRYYYDSTYRGIDLDRHQARTDSAIDAAGSIPEITAALADFLHVLDDSHTRFYPPGLSVTADYGWTWITVGDDCLVATVKEKSSAAEKGLVVGDRVLAIDGVKPTRDNIGLIGYVYHQLSPRPGMRLLVEREDGQRAELVIESVLTQRGPVEDLSDLEGWRRYREAAERTRPRHRVQEVDSVLVWHLPRFLYQDREIDRVMERARRFPWLVLDLRGNPGGAIEAEIRLLGHFFPEPFDAYTEVWRDSTVLRRVVPKGREPFLGQVVVLIDSRSASAAEISSRVLQMRGRATVVGDRSAGAVQTSYGISLELGSIFQERTLPFGMSVTITDVIMPDDARIEKLGVIPNVAALPTGRDLAAKRDPAMQFALELAGLSMTPEEAWRIPGR